MKIFLLDKLVNFNTFWLDTPVSGQLGFQDPASPIAEGLIDLHHYIFFFLIIVVVFVFWMLSSIIVEFNENNYNWLSGEKSREFVVMQGVVHGATIEIVWTIIPTLILCAIAIPSFGLLYAADEIIPAEVTIKVIGHQWYWSYELSDYMDYSKYPFMETDIIDDKGFSFDSYMVPEDELSGRQVFRLLEVDNYLYVPSETHIRFIITSDDVLHCWAIPSLGVKMDAVPGRLNMTSTYIKRDGVFFGQCSELCGVNHGFMPIVVRSVSFDDWITWCCLHNEEFENSFDN